MFFGKGCGRMDDQSSEGDGADGDGLTDLQREEVTLPKIERVDSIDQPC